MEVRRLRYRGPITSAGQTEFAIGDALRTEVVDDGRLIIVRNLALGRIALRGRNVAAATSAAWRNVIGTARHGGSSDAPGANCVWFHDAEEARALLMRELARGRTPLAWFWPLAVPDWHHVTLEQYLERRLSQVFADTAPGALETLIGEVLAAECVDVLAAVIAARMPVVPLASDGVASPAAKVESGEADQAESARVDAAGSVRAMRVTAGAVFESVPQTLRKVLMQLVNARKCEGFVERLARALVLRAHPSLAVNPRALDAVIAAFCAILRGERADFGGGAVAQGAVRAAPMPARVRDEPVVVPEGERDHRFAADAAARDADTSEIPPAPAPLHGPADVAIRGEEVASAAAGLFLTIVPLIRLGWREWLAERPELLVHQPGVRLLRGIAGHYHVPATDPVWPVLAIGDGSDEPPEALIDVVAAWRAGLNGWLRRRARMKLADVVLRRGWLLHGSAATTVRLPMNAIDLRLRRLALDSDPGWVDWLGQSYRIAFRDQPLESA